MKNGAKMSTFSAWDSTTRKYREYYVNLFKLYFDAPPQLHAKSILMCVCEI